MPGTAERAALLAVVGPTGTGKSAFSLRLAQALQDRGRSAEIVNADAMQLYRGMDIGTAKLREHERRGIPHHLLDVLDVTEESTAADYQQRARAVIEDILARGAVPILVGGSGLYVSAVIHELAFPGTDPAIRAALEAQLATEGLPALLARLERLDPSAAAAVDRRNPRRVVRALEVIELTGSSARHRLPAVPRQWRAVRVIGLDAPREELARRLDERVVGMWRDGLLEEVRGLLRAGLERGSTARRAIGYAQAAAQLRGELQEAEAIQQTQALTRRYARRQRSWFRRYPEAEWLTVPGSADPERIDPEHIDPERIEAERVAAELLSGRQGVRAE